MVGEVWSYAISAVCGMCAVHTIIKDQLHMPKYAACMQRVLNPTM